MLSGGFVLYLYGMISAYENLTRDELIEELISYKNLCYEQQELCRQAATELQKERFSKEQLNAELAQIKKLIYGS